MTSLKFIPPDSVFITGVEGCPITKFTGKVSVPAAEAKTIEPPYWPGFRPEVLTLMAG